MARPSALSVSQLGVARTVAGVIAADSATMTDANYPVASGFNATGFETVWVGVDITGGTNPSATIALLARDADADDGKRWKAIGTGTTGALTGAALVEMRVDGRPLVFPQITAVASATSTTAISILIMPGKARLRAGVGG
jgi:hypothetical protein